MACVMAVRTLIRQAIPLPIRWRVRQARRSSADFRSRVVFAERHTASEPFPVTLCHYERPLICYPGQEQSFVNKCNNVDLSLHSIDLLVIKPGETFSFWRCVGRSTARRKYRSAAALKGGVLIEDIGGAICLVSTLIYNIGLLGGMAITERWCHSVDNYGEERYFELGRDSAVEYAYRDLRLRNDLAVPIQLSAWAEAQRIVAEARAPRAIEQEVSVEVGPQTLVTDGATSRRGV